jgi:hypothetical protein
VTSPSIIAGLLLGLASCGGANPGQCEILAGGLYECCTLRQCECYAADGGYLPYERCEVGDA